jgi:hypothetical protein
VSTSDWGHLDDHPFDELDPVVFGEDAGIRHAVIVVYSE